MNSPRARLKLVLATAIAALALGSVGAGSAQAVPTFTAGAYPTTLTGSQAESFIYNIDGYEVTCASFSLSGSMTEAETMLVLTPTYATCHAVNSGNSFGAIIRFNKCFYTVQVTSKKTNGEFSHIGTANLECFSNEQVEIEIVGVGGTLCEYTIAPATGLSEMRYGTMAGTPDDLTAQWLLKKLPYKRRIGTVTFCGPANGNAEYIGNATIRGFNEKGTQVNLEVIGS